MEQMMETTIFEVDQNEIANENLFERMDVQFYHPKQNTLNKILKTTKFDVKTLNEIAQVTRAAGADVDRYVSYVDEGIPFLRVQNVHDFELDLSNVKKIPLDVHKKLKNSQLSPNELVLVTTGAGKVGTTTIIPSSLKEANASDQIARIRPFEGINPDYLAFFLNSKIGKSQTTKWQSGSTRPRTIITNIRKLSIIIPPPEIQEKITQTLLKPKIDLINERKKLEKSQIEILEKINQAYGRVYLLLGIEINPKNNKVFSVKPTDLENRFDVSFFLNHQRFSIKPKFEICKMNEIISFSNEIFNIKKYDLPTINYIEISNMDPIEGIIKSYNKIPIEEAPSRAKRIIHENEIIIAMSGIDRTTNSLAIAVVPKTFDNFIASSGFGVIRPKKTVLQKYLFYLLRSDFMIHEIKARLTGTILPNIRKEEFLNINIPKPPKPIQQKVIKILDNNVIIFHKICSQLKSIKLKSHDVDNNSNYQFEKFLS